VVFFQHQTDVGCDILEGEGVMINYMIKRDDNKWQISREHTIQIFNNTIQKYLNPTLNKQLTDFMSRLRITKKVFNYPSKPPIFVDGDTLLLCIRSHRMEKSLYINYFAIRKYSFVLDGVIIEFNTMHCLKIGQTHAFRTQMRRAKEIIDFFAGEKMFS